MGARRIGERKVGQNGRWYVAFNMLLGGGCEWHCAPGEHDRLYRAFFWGLKMLVDYVLDDYAISVMEDENPPIGWRVVALRLLARISWIAL